MPATGPRATASRSRSGAGRRSSSPPSSALRPLVVGRRVEGCSADMGAFWRDARRRQPAALDRPREGRDPPRDGGGRRTRSGTSSRRRAGKPLWKLICDMTPEEHRRARRLPVHHRRPAAGAGARTGCERSAPAAAAREAELRRRRLSGLLDLGRLAGLRRRQDPAALPRGAGRGLDAVQAEGRGRRRRRPCGGRRSSARRSGPDRMHGGRRQPALGRRPRRSPGWAGSRRVRPVLDRGADLARRHPGPRGDRPRRRADPGRDRRARPQPGDVQAALPGRTRSASARSTPAGSAASTRSSRCCCWRPKFGVPVCPHAGGVGLCELVQHLSVIDYVCVSAARSTAG